MSDSYPSHGIDNPAERRDDELPKLLRRLMNASQQHCAWYKTHGLDNEATKGWAAYEQEALADVTAFFETLQKERDDANKIAAAKFEIERLVALVGELRSERLDLLAALTGLLPEGWDDGTMDHMPGVRDARLAIGKAEGQR